MDLAEAALADEALPPHPDGAAARSPAAAGLAFTAPLRLAAFIRHTSGVTLTVCDQFLVSGAHFVTVLLLARASQVETGVYHLTFGLVAMVRGFQEYLVCGPYAIYSHRRTGAALAAYSGSALIHQFVLSLAATLGLLALAAILHWGTGPAIAPDLVTLACMMPLLMLREWARQFAFARSARSAPVLIDAAVSVLQLAALALLSQQGWLNTETVYLAGGAACALIGAAWFWAERRSMRFEWSQVWSDWRLNWGFGRWAAGCQVAGSLLLQIVPWMLALSHGAAATGLLAACSALVGVAGTFVRGVGQFLTPGAARAFAQGGATQLRCFLRTAARVFAATLGLFCLAVMLVGAPLTELIFGSQYAGAHGVLTVLALNVLVMSMTFTTGNGLWAVERPQSNLVADLCALLAVLVAAACLVGPFGTLGASLALLISSIVGATVRATLLWRALNDLQAPR